MSGLRARFARFRGEAFVHPAHPPVRWLALSALVIVADQFSKLLVLYYLQPFAKVTVLPPVLDLTLLFNRGAAFSMFAGANGWQQWLFVVLAVVFSGLILVWLRRLPPRGRAWLAAGLALILAGALGNAIDRVWHGHVVDFILVHWRDDWYFPAFNVADSAITVGAVIALADAFFRRRPPVAEEADEERAQD